MRNAEVVPLANPLSSDMDVLRPSLIPGLLNTLRHNVSRKNYDAALFEVGRVFVNVNGHTKEERHVAIALTGQRAQSFWSGDDRDAKFDAMDLKGIVEDVIEHFGKALNLRETFRHQNKWLQHAPSACKAFGKDCPYVDVCLVHRTAGHRPQ